LSLLFMELPAFFIFYETSFKSIHTVEFLYFLLMFKENFPEAWE